MRRRDFTVGLLLASAAQSVRAQEPAKQRRIAIVISTGPAASINDGIVKLAESGLGRSRVGRVNGRDEDASRLDLRRPSLPR
jgi:hypothetical protein